VFFIPGAGKTLAEMTLEAKNAISHRGKAFRAMAGLIHRLYRPDADRIEQRNKAV
jgi:inosine/xanthosine triphosphate pyrophosphatase family protein